MTHFASELRQNPKMRLRSLLLRPHVGPTTGSGRPEPEIRNLDAGVALLHACNAIAASSRSTSLPRARALRPPRRRRRRRDGREPSHRGGTVGAAGEEQREGRGEHERVGQGGEHTHGGRRGETKLQAQAIRRRCSGGGEFHRRVESAGGEQEGEKRKNAGGLGF